MKALLTLLLAGGVVAVITFSQVEREKRQRAENERRTAEALALREQRNQLADARASGRTLTWVPGLRRYVEHDSRVSAMQSIGGGGGYAGQPRQPKADNRALVKKEFGWEGGGTALDKKGR